MQQRWSFLYGKKVSMKIIEKKLDEIIPYEKNPRLNDDTVKSVAESIKEFGWKQPIVIDKDGVIIAGHTRWKAAKQLDLETAPCVIAEDLTEEQVKAYRLADNKIAEQSFWDFELLEGELDDILDIDMDLFGFNSAIADATSYIDDLLENDFADHKVEQSEFSMTFTFDNKYKAPLDNFIKENGKDGIVDMIVKEIENA